MGQVMIAAIMNQEPDDSQVCYWFEKIPHEIRQVLMANLDIGSFLNLMQCSTQFHQELNEESSLILARYGFDLSVTHERNYCRIVVKCDADSRYRRIACYEGIVNFYKKSDAKTQIYMERTRYPHTQSLRSKILVSHRKSESYWNEYKNIDDLVVQYLGSYLKTFGKYVRTLNVKVGSNIAERISKLWMNNSQCENISIKFAIDGTITVDELMELKAETVKLFDVKWSTSELLKFLEIWITGKMNPNISEYDIKGTFDYDEEIETYLKGKWISRFNFVRGTSSGVYTHRHNDYSAKVTMNQKECSFSCKKDDVVYAYFL